MSIVDRNEQPTDPREEEFSILEVTATLLRYRRTLVVIPIALALLLGVFALLKERRYVASASFYPQTSDMGGNRVMTLAQQFGIELGGGQAAESPEFYADLIQSRELLRHAVESEYTVPGESEARRLTLVEWYRVQESPDPLRPYWLMAVKELEKNLAVYTKPETGVVGLEVTSLSPDLAEQVAARLLELINQYNLQTRQSQAQEELRFAETQMAQARQELAEAEALLEEFMIRNRQFRDSPPLSFEFDRLQRRIGMRQDILTSLAQSVEQAKVQAARDVPVITVISPPADAAEPKSRGVVLHALAGFLAGLLIAAAIAFLRENARQARAEGRAEYREFSKLRDETWRGLRKIVAR